MSRLISSPDRDDAEPVDYAGFVQRFTGSDVEIVLSAVNDVDHVARPAVSGPLPG